MKKLAIVFLFFTFFVVPAFSQVGPVLIGPTFLDWDFAGPSVDAFRIYLSRDPGVLPDGTPDATVSYPTKEWLIVAASGQWYAVVTAAAGTIESPPSNEVPFFMCCNSPTNARVRQGQ